MAFPRSAAPGRLAPGASGFLFAHLALDLIHDAVNLLRTRPGIAGQAVVDLVPEVVIVPENEGRFLNGQTVTVALPVGSPAGPGPDGTEVRAHAADGRLLAIALLAPGGRCSPRKVLARKEAA